MKKFRILLHHEDGADARAQLLRKAERRAGPIALDGSKSSQDVFIARRAHRRSESLFLESFVPGCRFQLFSEVVVDVMAEAAHGSVHRSAEKEPWGVGPIGFVHTDEASVHVVREQRF